MPIKFSYSKEKKAIFGTLEGSVTFDEFKIAMKEVVESEIFAPNTPALWDVTKLDFETMDKDFAEQLIALRKANPERGDARLAIVADKDLSFGMSRMYEMLSYELPQKMMVFKNYTDAEKWLLGEN